LSCATTSFVSTWKAPGAQPVDARGSKVIAVVMAKSDVMRRAGEDRLAYEISAHGAQGVAFYRLLPEAQGMPEAEERGALERANAKLVVVMRPVQVEQNLVVNQYGGSMYGGSMYGGYYGGYHGYGWSHPYGGADVRVDTVVSIETLVYSLPENKLLWGGQSKTTNPETISQLVAEVAAAAADELEHAGLIAKR
jgi:hypothetical protein